VLFHVFEARVKHPVVFEIQKEGGAHDEEAAQLEFLLPVFENDVTFDLLVINYSCK